MNISVVIGDCEIYPFVGADVRLQVESRFTIEHIACVNCVKETKKKRFWVCL